jgi:hypothetical protein
MSQTIPPNTAQFLAALGNTDAAQAQQKNRGKSPGRPPICASCGDPATPLTEDDCVFLGAAPQRGVIGFHEGRPRCRECLIELRTGAVPAANHAVRGRRGRDSATRRGRARLPASIAAAPADKRKAARKRKTG